MTTLAASTSYLGTGTTLAGLKVGTTATLVGLRLSEREASWLRAVGLYEGVLVTPLRFAPLGGPVHFRTSTGAELAIDLELARAVDVESLAP
jgi:Fe2+ transport system protein FeoA